DAPVPVSCSNSLTTGAASTMNLDARVGSSNIAGTFTFPSVTLGTQLNVTGDPGEKLVFTAASLQNNIVINNAIDLTLGGSLTGPYALVMNGAGKLTLNGAGVNQYTGGTTV